nr:transposase [Aeromicrobium phragmitis]
MDSAVSVGSTVHRAHQHATKGRNVVERGFSESKRWSGLATRYDKLALTYRGGVVLRAVTLWLKATA